MLHQETAGDGDGERRAQTSLEPVAALVAAALGNAGLVELALAARARRVGGSEHGIAGEVAGEPGELVRRVDAAGERGARHGASLSATVNSFEWVSNVRRRALPAFLEAVCISSSVSGEEDSQR